MVQANDGVLLKGKLGEYADAFAAVDKDGNGEFGIRLNTHPQIKQ